MQLDAGPLALINATFLVADVDISAEKLLIDLSVLQNLRVDKSIVLEQRRDVLDGSDCSFIGNASVVDGGGYVICQSIGDSPNEPNQSRKKKSAEDMELSCSRVEYLDVRIEKDPFPDASLLEAIDIDQHNEVPVAINKMIHTAMENRFLKKKLSELQDLIEVHANILRVSFSADPPAQVPSLRIDFIPDAVPIRVSLRAYCQKQLEFMSEMVSNLIKCGMKSPYPTCTRPSATSFGLEVWTSNVSICCRSTYS